jgi:hypothetical protein
MGNAPISAVNAGVLVGLNRQGNRRGMSAGSRRTLKPGDWRRRRQELEARNPRPALCERCRRLGLTYCNACRVAEEAWRARQAELIREAAGGGSTHAAPATEAQGPSGKCERCTRLRLNLPGCPLCEIAREQSARA